jgi:predicted nucleic acid-binding protein
MHFGNMPQTIYEFYVVATRPLTQNGFELSIKEVLAEIDNLTQLFSLLLDKDTIYSLWYNLMATYDVKGKKSHDARLVAFMQSHQIKQIYTLNTEDFKRFEDLIELI